MIEILDIKGSKMDCRGAYLLSLSKTAKNRSYRMKLLVSVFSALKGFSLLFVSPLDCLLVLPFLHHRAKPNLSKVEV